jgi:cytochrome c-type biogenesis protein CcmH/NrfG
MRISRFAGTSRRRAEAPSRRGASGYRKYWLLAGVAILLNLLVFSLCSEGSYLATVEWLKYNNFGLM